MGQQDEARRYRNIWRGMEDRGRRGGGRTRAVKREAAIRMHEDFFFLAASSSSIKKRVVGWLERRERCDGDTHIKKALSIRREEVGN